MLLVNTPKGVLLTPKGCPFLTADDIHIFPLKMLQHSSLKDCGTIPTQVMHKCTIFPLTLEIAFYSVLFTCWVKKASCCYNLHFLTNQ